MAIRNTSDISYVVPLSLLLSLLSQLPSALQRDLASSWQERFNHPHHNTGQLFITLALLTRTRGNFSNQLKEHAVSTAT